MDPNRDSPNSAGRDPPRKDTRAPLVVRELAPDDAATFRRVRLKGLRECPTAFGASYAQDETRPMDDWVQRLTPSQDRWVLGTFQGGELVGVVGFIRETGEKTRHKAALWGMYVVPEVRRQGVGRLLVATALGRAKAATGLHCVQLHVMSAHAGAVRLYQRLGFVIRGEEPAAVCVDGLFYSALFMVWTAGASQTEFLRNGSGGMPPASPPFTVT